MNLTLLYLNVGGFELILFFIPVLLWLWAMIDLLKSDFSNSINKIVWAIVIIFIPLAGALLYLLIGRSQKIKSVKR